MEKFQKLSRAEMRNVLGGVDMPPGDCPTGCGPLAPCPTNQPYCNAVDCIDKNGVLHSTSSCSPNLPGE